MNSSESVVQPFPNRGVLKKISRFSPEAVQSGKFTPTLQPGCRLDEGQHTFVRSWLTAVLGGDENVRSLRQSPKGALAISHLLTYLVQVATGQARTYAEHRAFFDDDLPAAVGQIGGLRLLHQIKRFDLNLAQETLYIELLSGKSIAADDDAAQWFLEQRPCDRSMSETTGEFIARWEEAAIGAVRALQHATFDAHLAQVLHLQEGPRGVWDDDDTDEEEFTEAGGEER